MSVFIVFLVIMTGLCFGSFVTMASYRLPRGEDMVFTPSHCPACNTRLRGRDLWPPLSWALYKGRCRTCKSAISPRYPLTELATGAMFVFLYLKFGITAQSVILAGMGVALMIMIVVDMEHYIIPDSIHAILLPLAVVYHWVMGDDWLDAVGGFLIAGSMGLSLHYGYRLLRKKEGLGFGDVKFFAVAGLWLGIYPLVPFIFFSGLLGVFMGLLWRALGKGPIFPFGPSLALSLFICTIYPTISSLLRH